MKLYTEEQVRSLLNKMDIIYSLEDLTPIELPSDEEIDELLERKSSVNLLGFITGVKWMKEQILKPNYKNEKN